MSEFAPEVPVHRPFHFFYEYGVDLRQDLALGAVALTIAAVVSLVAPSMTMAAVGLMAVACMPFLTYLVIGYHACRGTLEPQRWRTVRAKSVHQCEELYHYAARVVIAFAAGQSTASWFGAGESLLSATFPVLIYVILNKAYHDMHVVMHLRGHDLPPEERTLASRTRPLAPPRRHFAAPKRNEIGEPS